MAGARRRDVNARTVSDVKLLPMSDKRPLEEPMISPHSQQLLVAPMDQVPSSDKAIWLYEASQAPDNIARILSA